MAHVFAPGLTVSSHHVVRRRRELPIAGEILVKKGDAVSREQIIARAYLEGEVRLIRVAETLCVTPQEVEKTLRVAVGTYVSEGELLAEIRGLWGLFRSTITAPISGIVEFVTESTGHLGIRAAPRKLELSAYLEGLVVEVEGERAVVLESEASFVQGIFGVGGERIGTVQVLDVEPFAVVSESHVPAEAPGAILIGGRSPTLGAVLKARDAGAVGFVTGSIDDHTLREYVGRDIGVAVTGDENISMTLIVTEGFGPLPMGQRVWETLRAMNGARASLNGATQVRAGAVRPEIISAAHVQFGSSIREEAGATGLQVGSRVRLIRVPFFGQSGTVEDLPHDPQRIETGAWSRVLTARLDDGRIVTVPRANVELL
jgi:hypothetical protein